MSVSTARATRHPVDEYRPFSKLVLFGVQHVLVMAATPISSVFLVSKTLHLSGELSEKLLAAAFVLSGIGTLLQSLGPWKTGGRLPFVMLPGGAPVVLFLAIAKEQGLPTASGAVILTGIFYFVILPVFARLLRFFPPVVIGTMIIIIGVNLVSVSGQLIVGQVGAAGFGDLRNVGLGLATVGFTVLFFWVLSGMARQLAVMLGLIAGALLSAAVGAMHLSSGAGGIVHAPTLLPFGTPHFDLLAALPLMLFAIPAMAEATGQTILNAEVVGKEIEPRRVVPRVISADALVSVLGGMFGTSLMVTSGENIGIVRVSGVRSRYVTAVAGVILVAVGVLTPIAHLLNAIPAAVIGGTSLIVYAIVAVLGVQMLRRVDLSDHANVFICATALALGLLPILVPGAYSHFPADARTVLSSGVAVGAFVAVLLNVVFHHLPWRRPDTAIPGTPTVAAPVASSPQRPADVDRPDPS